MTLGIQAVHGGICEQLAASFCPSLSVANALLDGGACITSYKTERESELWRFAHTFAPYTDVKALYAALPDKHVAINKVRLPSGKDAPAFIANMVPLSIS